MAEYFEIEIAGLKRKLQKFPISDKIDIAAFIIDGDIELTVKGSEMLLKKAPEFDVILTAEAKSIPIVYEMSRQAGKPFVVAKKALKVYMENPISADVKTITSLNKQHLYIGQREVDMLKGKKVLIVDDVISTGAALNALRALAVKAGGIEVGACAFLAEGDAADRDDIFYLERLPLFVKE